MTSEEVDQCFRMAHSDLYPTKNFLNAFICFSFEFLVATSILRLKKPDNIYFGLNFLAQKPFYEWYVVCFNSLYSASDFEILVCFYMLKQVSKVWSHKNLVWQVISKIFL